MGEEIFVYEMTKKKTKVGRDMWSIKTDKGYMGIFEGAIAAQIQENMVNDLDIKKDKTFINVTAWNGAHEREEEDEFDNQESESQENFEDEERPRSGRENRIDIAIKRRTASMMISYAKDMAVAGLIKKEEIGDTAKGLMRMQEELAR